MFKPKGREDTHELVVPLSDALRRLQAHADDVAWKQGPDAARHLDQQCQRMRERMQHETYEVMF